MIGSITQFLAPILECQWNPSGAECSISSSLLRELPWAGLYLWTPMLSFPGAWTPASRQPSADHKLSGLSQKEEHVVFGFKWVPTLFLSLPCHALLATQACRIY